MAEAADAAAAGDVAAEAADAEAAVRKVIPSVPILASTVVEAEAVLAADRAEFR